MKPLYSLLFFLSVSIISGCYEINKTDDVNNVYSLYKPVLMDKERVNTDLIFMTSRENKMIVSMRSMGSYMLALDYGLGVHIIDVSNLNNPIKVGFYQIPACVDFEVKENKIFANNYNDFVVIDFSDIKNPLIVKREKNVFKTIIRTFDGLEPHPELYKIPDNTVIISYEKI